MGIGAAVSGGISALGSLFGASESSSAAKAASQAQLQASREARAAQLTFYQDASNKLAPYIDLGNQAAGQLGSRLNELTTAIPLPTMSQSDLESTPGYQFTLGQGLKATQNSAAARGLGASGAAMKGAATYATGLSDSTYNTRFDQAQTQWQDQFNNQQGAYNKLYQTAGLGTSAAGALAGQAIQTGQGTANSLMAGGNAQAAGINASGQATAAGITGATAGFNNALQQYLSGNALGLYGQGGGSSGSGGILSGLKSALNGGF